MVSTPISVDGTIAGYHPVVSAWGVERMAPVAFTFAEDWTCHPSDNMKVGDVISVRKPPVTFSCRILKTIEQRVGAKMLPEIYENITPQDQYDLLEMNRIGGFVKRAAGLGRPTKKDRRDMEDFLSDSEFELPEECDFDE